MIQSLAPSPRPGETRPLAARHPQILPSINLFKDLVSGHVGLISELKTHLMAAWRFTSGWGLGIGG